MIEKCTWCDEPATGYTDPPACEQHADLLFMIDWQREQGQPVTVDSTTDLVAQCQANNGSLYIDRFDVADLLPPMLADLPREIRFIGGIA